MNEVEEITATEEPTVTTIEKVSNITPQVIADYLRIAQPTDEDIAFLTTAISVSIDFILKYTGIEDESELDGYTDMIQVVYVLCQDMYDTRGLYVDNSNVNRVVESILGLHQRNLL